MARLTGCCCCFDNLRDGARAVGITLLVLISLELVGNIADTAIHFVEQQNTSPVTGETIAYIVFRFVVNILLLIMNALLVHGVNSCRRGMVLAWLIVSGIIHGLGSLGVLVFFFIFLAASAWELALLLLAVASLIGVFWYWFVVVLHYYQEMNEQNGFVYGKQVNDGAKLAF